MNIGRYRQRDKANNKVGKCQIDYQAVKRISQQFSSLLVHRPADEKVCGHYKEKKDEGNDRRKERKWYWRRHIGTVFLVKGHGNQMSSVVDEIFVEWIYTTSNCRRGSGRADVTVVAVLGGP